MWSWPAKNYYSWNNNSNFNNLYNAVKICFIETKPSIFNISVVSKKKLESSEIKDTIDIISKLSERCELVSISINSEGSSINLIVNLSDLHSITQINQEFNSNFPDLDFVLVRESQLNV